MADRSARLRRADRLRPLPGAPSDTTPLLLVHGFDGHSGISCAGEQGLSRTLGSRIVTVGLYGGDTHCDVPGLAGATTETSIEDLGRHVADAALAIKGPVDLLGHSMGGLVVEAAFADLPPGKVKRMVTLETPYAGLPTAVGCPQTQCVEMLAGSALLTSLVHHSDLCVGSTGDEFVPITSTLSHCRHTFEVAKLHHGEVLGSPAVIARVLRTLAS